MVKDLKLWIMTLLRDKILILIHKGNKNYKYTEQDDIFYLLEKKEEDSVKIMPL